MKTVYPPQTKFAGGIICNVTSLSILLHDIISLPKVTPCDKIYFFVSVEASRPSQQFQSCRDYSRLPGLNQYQAEDKVSCSRTQCSPEQRLMFV